MIPERSMRPNTGSIRPGNPNVDCNSVQTTSPAVIIAQNAAMNAVVPSKIA